MATRRLNNQPVPTVGDEVELVIDGSRGTLRAINERNGVTWYHVATRKASRIDRTGDNSFVLVEEDYVVIRLQRGEFYVCK